jgi:hypothetical protein
VDVPYWSIYCLWCNGYIADALLECIPVQSRAHPGYLLLVLARPGAALGCPYCNGLFGFDEKGQPQPPQSGWPVFRYGRAELESKRDEDGEPSTTTLADWALRCRFLWPGSHPPFGNYTYAEQAPLNEIVP